MEKNVAGQKWIVYAFDVTTNLPKTGDAANITANLRKDCGAASGTDDTNPTELEDGSYYFNMLQAESNANLLSLHPESSTSNIIVIAIPAAIYTRPPNFQTMGIESDGDLAKVNLCDTTTTNTDMRGTESAATAAALATHDGKLDTVDTVVDGIQTDLSNGTDGLGVLKTLIDAIDISGIAATLDAMKGAGWTTQTLVDIRAAITAISGLEGARTVTVQVYETGGTTPIADDTIGIWNSDQSLLLGVAVTDTTGQITVGLDDGTYKLVSRKTQVVFIVPETIVVTQNETFIVYGTAQTYPIPDNPDACNVYCDLLDFGIVAEEGVMFSATLANTPQVIGAVFINDEKLSDITDASGRAILTLPQGAEFIISSDAFGKRNRTIRIDTTDKSSIVLANEA